MHTKLKMTAIGIDLGTTYTCVAALENRHVRVFQNRQGDRITPSCVAFTDEERLVGKPALSQMDDNPQNTIYAIKRIIGKSYDDSGVEQDCRNWPFHVFPDEERRPVIEVTEKDQRKNFLSEQISAMILAEMKKIAEKCLEGTVYNAVITVPSYFTHKQREATINAARIANLRVMRIINEPTAAAIAYGMLKNVESLRNVLVYDLGGGTFDVTVLTIHGKNFNVKASTGKTRLGGEDFTQRMVSHFVAEMKSKYGKDISRNDRAMSRLRQECERVKKELSFAMKERVRVEALVDGITLDLLIRRSKFKKLNNDYFEETFRSIVDALKEAKMTEAEIHDVILVGGSSRIPYIGERLKELFGEEKIRESLSPDEVVGYGAAVYAGHLSGDTVPQIGEVDLSDVTPLSLGICIKGDITDVLIKRNAKVPTQNTRTYCNSHDNQRKVIIQVCQGECAEFKRNDFLGEFFISITPRPKGKTMVEVCFSLDVNGILKITACEQGEGEPECVIMQMGERLNNLDIKKLKEEGEKYHQEGEELKAKKKALTDLESLLDRVQMHCKDKQVQDKCEEIEEWLDFNPEASSDEIEKKKTELEILENNVDQKPKN